MIKRILNHLREHRMTTITAIVLTVLETQLEFVVPFLQIDIID